jgi:NAD dependent epimerase/dehydratase
MRSVVVTGADGFIGSHLVELLASRGVDVRAVVAYNFQGARGWLDTIDLPPNLTIVSGDVRDPYFCETVIEGTDTVFHLAALIGIPYSYIAPESYIQTNITGTHNICKSSLKHGVKKLIVTSTSEVYGSARYVPIDEAHPFQPQSPYSASKIAADAVALSYYYSFGLPVVIARPFNTFGPRQSSRAIIPTIITQMLKGTTLKLGDLTPTRDLNYVSDTCAGFASLVDVGGESVIGETINICSNFEVSMAEVVERLSSIIGVQVNAVVDSERLRPKESEVQRLWGDNSKLLRLTGFKHAIDLDTGLRRTVEWFQSNIDRPGYDIERYIV